MSLYHYASKGIQEGPLDIAALVERMRNAPLQRHLVWRRGMTEWVDAHSVPEIAEQFAIALKAAEASTPPPVPPDASASDTPEKPDVRHEVRPHAGDDLDALPQKLAATEGFVELDALPGTVVASPGRRVLRILGMAGILAVVGIGVWLLFFNGRPAPTTPRERVIAVLEDQIAVVEAMSLDGIDERPDLAFEAIGELMTSTKDIMERYGFGEGGDNFEEVKGRFADDEEIQQLISRLETTVEERMHITMNTGASPEDAQPDQDDAKQGILTPVPVSRVTASSFASGVSRPENATDDDMQTWWTPGDPHTSGEDAWIMIEFPSVTDVTAVEILNGSHHPDYPNYGDMYPLNNRLTRARLEFSSGQATTITLDDVDSVQTVIFPRQHTRFVRLIPMEWNPGSTWKDLCISYFRAFGP